MAIPDQASQTCVGPAQALTTRTIASGVPLAAAVYVASGHLWVGVTVAIAVVITGALLRKLRKSASPALPAE